MSPQSQLRTHSERSSLPAVYPDNMDAEEFRIACAEYAEWVQTKYKPFEPLDFDLIGFKIVHDFERQAADIWYDKHPDGVDVMLIQVAFDMYNEFGWGDEVRATLKHELLHAVEIIETGDTSHDDEFESLCEAVGANMCCEPFGEHKYEVYCCGCDELVARKFEACDVVENPEQYVSSCCGTVYRSETV